MKNKAIIKVYLIPTLLQITIIAALVGILKLRGFELGYNSFLGILFISLAGASSALWGIVYQVRCHSKSPLEILKDFFNIKQSVKSYTLVLIFLMLEFSSVIINRGFKIESLFLPLLLFFKAIVFGGIEELGWRYSFQPSLEKKIPYIASTLITFVCWGVWHLLFFYIDGSLGSIHILVFLLGLLTNSFILSALFDYSNSLWICVMTHALINTFSQMSINDNILLDFIAKAICIFFAVYLYLVSKKERIMDN
jgi:CAAX amino terminal protease family protein